MKCIGIVNPIYNLKRLRKAHASVIAPWHPTLSALRKHIPLYKRNTTVP